MSDAAWPGDCLRDIDTVVLAGGLGTRIRDTLGDTPKLLAPIGGRPFLDHLTGWLTGFGARRLILGLGHLGGVVVEYLEAHPPQGLDVVPAVEPDPLGTAGALRFLDQHISSDPVLVMNGDSFTGADLCEFSATHRKAGAEASILCAEIDDTAAFGRVEISADGRVQAFKEKSPGAAGPGVINAGVYLFSAAMRARIAQMPGPSLERDVFQKLPSGTLNALTVHAPFVDIGTPEGLSRAADVIASCRD